MASWIRFAVRDRQSKIPPNRYKVGSEINPALPPPTVKSGYARIWINVVAALHCDLENASSSYGLNIFIVYPVPRERRYLSGVAITF